MPKSNLYIGVLSGTSADSIDALLVDFSKSIKVIDRFSEKIPKTVKDNIFELVLNKKLPNYKEKQKELDCKLGKLIGKCVNQLIKKSQVNKQTVKGIGSHGQTIIHSSSRKKPFSLQIGNPELIKKLTGIKVVHGFRQSDIANGGMGAPLTPAFHKEYMSKANINRAIVNIGGITNVTLLPAKGKIRGWDIGPGNCFIDQAVRKLTNGKKQFDNKGALARKGNPKVLENTIKKFLNTSYFKKPIPKSQSVENYDLKKFRFDRSEIKKLKDEDLISGLTEITFQAILRDLQKYCKKKYEIFFCGGGTNNDYLMDRFKELDLENLQFFETSDLGINPLDVEAMTFAWLAKKRIEKQKIELTSVTGSKPCLMGEVIN